MGSGVAGDGSGLRYSGLVRGTAQDAGRRTAQDAGGGRRTRGEEVLDKARERGGDTGTRDKGAE